MKIPGLRRSEEKIGGVVFFGRTLDKIRLHTQGQLPADYNRGTGFDARVCRFMGIEYPRLVRRVQEGGTDEQIFGWCIRNGRKPTDEEILFFNSFLAKRGWRDETSEELEQMKRARGFAHRTDIQTFFDFHRADEEQD